MIGASISRKMGYAPSSRSVVAPVLDVHALIHLPCRHDQRRSKDIEIGKVAIGRELV